jgi:hypothetical protein
METPRYFYHPDPSIWLSVDPLSDKYPNLTPYAYCANNPVILMDPDGREVIIKGDDVDGAVQQLQNQTNLKLSYDKNGNLSYSGKMKTPIDQMITDAIDNPDITVNMIANKSNSFDGIFTTEIGGGYFGNIYDDGKVNTYQLVSTSLLAAFDFSVGGEKSGLTMVHELAESFYGGQIALETKKGSPPSTFNGTTYEQAHYKANQIAIGNRGRLYLRLHTTNAYTFGKPGKSTIYSDGPFSTCFQIGWIRATDERGM